MNTLADASTLLQWVYFLITLGAFIPSFLYVIRYHRFTKGAWRLHYLGRSIMMMSAQLTLLFAFIAFNTGWSLFVGGSYPGRVIIGMALYALFAGFMWVYWWSFEKTQRDIDKKASTRNE